MSPADRVDSQLARGMAQNVNHKFSLGMHNLIRVSASDFPPDRDAYVHYGPEFNRAQVSFTQLAEIYSDPISYQTRSGFLDLMQNQGLKIYSDISAFAFRSRPWSPP